MGGMMLRPYWGGAAWQLAHLRPPRDMAALNLWRLSPGSTSIDELGIEQQAC